MTLKISTVEQTADSTSARGGKGNAELVMWDFGREITLNLQDALFSSKSMAIMFGDKSGPTETSDGKGEVIRTWKLDTSATDKVAAGIPEDGLPLGLGKKHKLSESARYYTANGELVKATGATEGDTATGTEWVQGAAFVTDTVKTKDHSVVTINAETFPGTYYCIGDTYARSETTGEDSFFQIQIPKAKMLSDVTLTLEAEGDPTVFDMQMKVLRPANKKMMKLVKYDID